MKIKFFLICFCLIANTLFAQVEFKVLDGGGSGLTADVTLFSTAKKEDNKAVLVSTDSLIKFNPEFHPFLNDDFGTAMNQNVTFSGTPEIIHNGGTSTQWTGSTIVGTWNFADSGKVTITSANNNDEALFDEETPTTVDLTGFTALTGKVDLDIYNDVNNNIIVFFALSGDDVGVSVNIDDFIHLINSTDINLSKRSWF